MKNTAPKNSNRRKLPIVSLFSGAGGLDLGFEKAGFMPIVAYDIFPPAVETYNHNRRIDVARIGDLATLDASTILADVRAVAGNVTPIGIIGGPPCQPFSHSNVHPSESDIRRGLPERFADLLKDLNIQWKLKFFLFENVRGISFKRHSEEMAKFRRLFDSAGFCLFEAHLNAKDYGVPQNRPRFFIVGVNRELFRGQEFKFPRPTQEQPMTLQAAFEDAFGVPPWPEPAFYEPALETSRIPFHPNHWTMVPRSQLFHNGKLKEKNVKGRSFRVLAWDKPSWAVAYGHRQIHIHPNCKRRLSIFESMILQGFPRYYELLGNFSQQVQLVCDAVPPPLANKLAKSIRDFIGRNGK